MRPRWICVLYGLFFALVLGPAPGAWCGQPSEQLRADIDGLYRIVDETSGAGSEQGGTRGRAIVDRMFDWTAMAEASLQSYWQKRTPAERAEFVQLFSDLFARAYLSRIHLVDSKKFQYLGDAVTGDRGTVKTRIFTKRGSSLDVEYLVRATPERRWLVRDVRVDAISLVDNYRAQFASVISQSSYEDLVKRLRALVK